MKSADEVETSRLRRKIAELRDELDEWRSGKRRVFWRIRWTDSNKDLDRFDHHYPLRARSLMRRLSFPSKLYRVTVKPKRKR